MWIVAVDKTYYPEIETFQEQTKAVAAYHDALNFYEQDIADGEVKIFIAQVALNI